MYLSASLTISKPIAAVAIAGMKPTAKVTLKLFDNKGQLIGKHEASEKPEKKISSIGFAVKEKEGFSKIDLEHVYILHERIEAAILSACDQAISQRLDEQMN